MRARTFTQAVLVVALVSAGALAGEAGTVQPLQKPGFPVKPFTPSYTTVVQKLDTAGLIAAYNAMMNGKKIGPMWTSNRTAFLNKAKSIQLQVRRNRYPGSDAGLKFIEAQLTEKINYAVKATVDNPAYVQNIYAAVGTSIRIVDNHRTGLLFYLTGQCIKGSSGTEGCNCPKTHVPDLRSCYPYSDLWSA